MLSEWTIYSLIHPTVVLPLEESRVGRYAGFVAVNSVIFCHNMDFAVLLLL